MWKSGGGNFKKMEGEGWRRILCGFVERVCGMAEDIVRRGCGGMGKGEGAVRNGGGRMGERQRSVADKVEK